VSPNFAAADVVVSASRSETQGLALCEAAAAGRVVVAPDRGGYAEVLGHEAGGLFPSRAPSAEELAGCVDVLLDDGDRRRRMEPEAARRADAAWSARTVAAATRLLIGLSWTESLLLGALLAPTDPVLRPGAHGEPEIAGGFSPTAEAPVPERSSDGGVGDEAIADAVRDALALDASTADLQLNVEVVSGVVRLRGTLSSIEDGENAEAVASTVQGVTEVADETDLA